MALAKLQSAEDWEPHLEEIHQLYITENKSVPDLIDHFKSQDILVTYVLVWSPVVPALFTSPMC